MENSTEPLIKTAFATSVSSNPREIAATPVKTFDASSKVVVKLVLLSTQQIKQILMLIK